MSYSSGKGVNRNNLISLTTTGPVNSLSRLLLNPVLESQADFIKQKAKGLGFIHMNVYTQYSIKIRLHQSMGLRNKCRCFCFFRKHISASVVLSLSTPKCFEYLALKINIGSAANCERLLLIGLYRQPSAQAQAIKEVFNLISSHGMTDLLLMGDANLDWFTGASSTLKKSL